ncbi:type I polyketide synthase [Chondromyces crocatus]|uniref:Polyketide synthase n=1 Tax=Chondromyces crocatus TaxID=52 RepID=B1GYF6_CHOCO|nr:type I polyketide synthase [Chondromyces crocatus]AKT41310.1 polyketide synthase [Chondromyces crocatus]CAQ18829.1 polyketide synthase [Chondromyces crocatus]
MNSGEKREEATTASAPTVVKRALAAVQDLRARLAAAEQEKHAPLAVVGLGCRFPGGADDPEKFWALLREGRDAVTEVPRSRWDVDALYDPDPDAPGKIASRHGAFLADVDRFDAGFFGIAPREAAAMDPQQRLLLEVTWEALEHAGIAADGLAGSRTGVFLGICKGDYLRFLLDDPERIDAYVGTGNAESVAAGRLSYLLGLKGPAVSMDTACSSSLVALHFACQSLRRKECDLALVGGVNLTLAPEISINFSRARMLAPDGRCKTFDAAADGYVRGEGCGVVVLKRLSDALADGDRVLAVIRGSAVNQDGRSSGLTAPNGPSQEAVIRDALHDAGVTSAAVGYVEAHGTGTSLGDPIEVEALGAVFGEERRERPCILGSVKTNIGHLEAAAGLAGLIKAILVVQHGEIPPHLHLRTPSPRIPWDALPLTVTTSLSPWNGGGGPRIAGVSSFGFSGTNAHVIVEQPPEEGASVSANVDAPDRPQLLSLSARSETALRALAGRYVERLAEKPSLRLAEVCFTANVGRAHLGHRLVVEAGTTEALRQKLAAFADGTSPSGMVSNVLERSGSPQIAFLFTGQGSQYAGMGRGLYTREPVFRETLDRCATLLEGQLPLPLLTVLFEEQTPRLLDQTLYTQPALFSLQVALAALWRSWGLRPHAVLGHSVGELAAACVAGAFDLEEGLRLVVERARLMHALPTGGAMAAVFADPAQVEQAILAEAEGRAVIAAWNGPKEVVLSGDADAVERTAQRLRAQGVRVQSLAVSHAFHSPRMLPALDALEHAASAITYRRPDVELVSNLTGAPLPELSAPYWRRHAREPVKFAEGVQALYDLGVRLFVEIGPQPTLLAMAQRCLPVDAATWLPSLRKGKDELGIALSSLAELHVRGVDVDWRALQHATPRRKVSLPTYPFQRLSYWVERSARPARSEGEKDVYELAWIDATHDTVASPGVGRWLIFADQGGLGEALAEQLSAGGASCTLAFAGREVDVASSETIARDVEALAGEALAGVVYAWGLDSPSPDESTVPALAEKAVLTALSVLQAIARRDGAVAPPRLWMVTRGAQATGGASPAVAQAPLWGLGRVFAVEHPDRWGGLVDLDLERPDHEVAPLADQAAMVANELGRDAGAEVAHRGGRRLIARLMPAGTLPGGPPKLDVSATYLVTGGLGAVGLHVARWLVAQGARSLALVGRRAPSDEALTALRGLEAKGASVQVFRGDVTVLEDVTRVVQGLDATGRRLGGVFHAAGVLEDGVLSRLDGGRMTRVLSPKVRGSWNLHLATRGRNLDFFVLFSSASSLLGSPGQGNYAAANAFLDALAHARRAAGEPSTSIHWGPWAGEGMAQRDARSRQRWASQGVHLLAPDDGLRLLGRLVAPGAPVEIAVLPFDWERLRASLPGAALPLLEGLACHEVAETAAPTLERARAGELVRKLEAAPAAERMEVVLAFVRGQAAEVLGFDGSHPLPLHRGMFELGFDSLMAVELKNRLQAAVGDALPLSNTVVFDHPTLHALAEFLAGRVIKGEAVIASRIQAASDDPIAIVGVGCRFPGGADGPDAFWQVLRDGLDAIVEVPKERWDIAAFHDPDPEAPGKMVSRSGGFLRDIDQFDADFFGIAPREATFMDPQQRLLLEVTWEALENAGIAPGELAGSRTGVFVGISGTDYAQLQLQQGDPRRINAYFATGGALSAAAGRLAYVLGLRGPAMAIDTACSSSLVAVHLACRSLHAGESSVAIAGGTNLVLLPETNVNLSRARMLAPDGRCKTFDAAADGYVRGEGCGVVVLKRLSDALANGDRVLAVIRGSAVNQDGRSVGLTAPNGSAQEAVLRDALASAGVRPTDVGYVEAHGTGTSLGDPIEVEALGAVLGEGRTPDAPFYLGSVKTNLGHLEAAAGVAGLIKVVLALQHEAIPPHLHFQTPSPHIRWEELPARVTTALTPWPRGGQRRIAGVSSFGFIGTNAHVIVEEAPASVKIDADSEVLTERPQLLSLSAKSEAALRVLAGRYAEQLAEEPSLRLEEVCFTANVGRAHLAHRLVTVASSTAMLCAELGAFAEGASPKGVLTGEARDQGELRVAFLFTGQGSQYAGMGRGLYTREPVFRETLDRCATLLEGQLPLPLLTVLFEEQTPGLLDQTLYTQPALFSLQVALAALWRSWGLRPHAVLGHSVGELAAACVAGAFDLEEGLRLVVERARLMHVLPAGGAMAAVVADTAQVEQALLAEAEGRAVIAAWNGPKEVVLSGDTDAVERTAQRLRAQGVRVQSLAVSHAFHSPRMLPALDALEHAASAITYRRPDVELVSNLTGAPLPELSAPYWRRHAREPVKFAEGVQALYDLGVRLFVEIGPQPTLLAMAQRCVPADGATWLPSLRKGKDDLATALSSLAELHVRGVDVDWRALQHATPRRKVSLPTYPFQRRRFWIEDIAARPARPRAAQEQAGVTEHPLLGRRVSSPAMQDVVFEALLSIHAPGLLDDHRVQGLAVVSGPTEASMILDAAARVLGQGPLLIEEMVIQEAFILPEEGSRRVHTVLTPRGDDRATFRLASCKAGDEEDPTAWRLHVSGQVRQVRDDEPSPEVAGPTFEEVQARCTEPISREAFYAELAPKAAFRFGPTYECIDAVWRRDREALCWMQLPQVVSADEAAWYRIYPSLLDACFQLFIAARFGLGSGPGTGDGWVPFAMRGLRFERHGGGRLWCHVAVDDDGSSGKETVRGELRLFDESGALVAVSRDLMFKRARREALMRVRATLEGLSSWLYELSWVEKQVARPDPGPAGRWLLLADRGAPGQESVGAALAARLAQHGDEAVQVLAGERFEVLAPGRVTVRPTDAGDLQDLFRWALEEHRLPLRGVVHLWALDGGAQEDCTASAVEAAVERACVPALLALQQIARAREGAGARLWVVTRHAQAVGEVRVDAAAATLAGLAAVAAVEVPAQWGGLVDLDARSQEPAAQEDEVEALLREIRTQVTGERVALRSDRRLVARLARSRRPATPADAVPISPDASYVITGGLGALGLQVARSLVQQGARHLALLGRGEPSDTAHSTVRAMKEAGARVLILSADVAQIEDVERALARVRAELPALRGVIHAAGVLADGMLVEQSVERFTEVMPPKVAGAWNLHLATRADPLDLFVLFSSAASLFGSVGQGNYAAANAFLDALAHHRRALGLPALSIDWGPWAGEGMAAQVSTRRWSDWGVERIGPEQGAQLLRDLLGRRDVAQLGVLSVSWPKLFERTAGSARLGVFELLAAEAQPARPGAAATPTSDGLAERLAQMEPKRRRELIAERVQQLCTAALGLDPAAPFDRRKPLFELGLDSLMAVELRNNLQRVAGVPLPPTVVFENPSADALTEFVLGHVSAEPVPATSSPTLIAVTPSPVTALPALPSLENLSEAELSDLLAAELSASAALMGPGMD